MKIKAPVNTVIVEPITGTERGGIVLPGVSEDHQRARVVAVGDRVTRDGELWNQLLMWASLKDEKVFSTLRKMRANGCTLETDAKTGYKIVHPDSYTSYDEDRKGLLACARELTHRLLTLRWSAAGEE